MPDETQYWNQKYATACDERGYAEETARLAIKANGIGLEVVQKRLEMEIEARRPFILLAAQIRKDAHTKEWIAYSPRYDCVYGFGKTPEEASRGFDRAWNGEPEPK